MGPSFAADQPLDLALIPNALEGRQHVQQLTDGFNNAFPSTNPEGKILII